MTVEVAWRDLECCRSAMEVERDIEEGVFDLVVGRDEVGGKFGGEVLARVDTEDDEEKQVEKLGRKSRLAGNEAEEENG